jgi:hypothetical protein
MIDVVVREASPDELSRVIDVQGLAFSADPVMRWLFQDSQTYLHHFPAFAEAFGSRAFEHSMAWIAGDFGGAQMWLPPGVESDGERLESIVTEGVATARRDTIFTMMEEMANVPLYERHGFRVVKTIQIDDAPPFFPMLRDAR